MHFISVGEIKGGKNGKESDRSLIPYKYFITEVCSVNDLLIYTIITVGYIEYERELVGTMTGGQETLKALPIIFHILRQSNTAINRYSMARQ